MKHLSIHVSGKVQGVFFRASTKEKAEEFNIKGNVRNNADGSVSIEAEGEEENLQERTIHRSTIHKRKELSLRWQLQTRLKKIPDRMGQDFHLRKLFVIALSREH